MAACFRNGLRFLLDAAQSLRIATAQAPGQKHSLLRATTLAEFFQPRQTNETHKDARHAHAICTKNVGENLVADNNALIFVKFHDLRCFEIAPWLWLFSVVDIVARNVLHEAVDALLLIVGKEQRFETNGLDLAEKRIDLRC